MRTKFLFALVTSFLVLGTSMPVQASKAELEPQGSPLRKLQRGFLNIVLSPFEVARALSQDTAKNAVIPTWATGLVRGGALTAGRIAAGAYEVVTFPLPFPAGYEPVVLPEFTWEYFVGVPKD